MAIIRVIYSIPDYKSTDVPLITFFHIHNLWDYRFPQRNRGRIISDPLQHYSIKRLDHILFCRQEGIFPSRCKSAFSKSCWPVVALTLEHTTVQTVCAFPQTTQPEIYIYFVWGTSRWSFANLRHAVFSFMVVFCQHSAHLLLFTVETDIQLFAFY